MTKTKTPRANDPVVAVRRQEVLKLIQSSRDGLKLAQIKALTGHTYYQVREDLYALRMAGLIATSRHGSLNAVWATTERAAEIGAEARRVSAALEAAKRERMEARRASSETQKKADKLAEDERAVAEFARPSVQRFAAQAEWIGVAHTGAANSIFAVGAAA